MTEVLPSMPFTTVIHSSGNSGAVPEGGEQGITTEKYHSGCRLGFVRGRHKQAERSIITRRVWVPAWLGSVVCLPLGRGLAAWGLGALAGIMGGDREPELHKQLDVVGLD